LCFGYREGGRAVLDGVDLRIERGDWLLLEGASGGGKSTFVSTLAGLRQPSSGLLTSGGLDRRALGESACADASPPHRSITKTTS
jgi:ATP-binding cassette subfamily B protein